MRFEQLELRNLLSGLSVLGGGLSGDPIDIIANQPGLRAILPGVAGNSNLVDGGGSHSMVGGDSDDLFTLLNAEAGETYVVDGQVGYDILALKSYLAADVSFVGQNLQISTSEGDFTVELVDIERISLADGDLLTPTHAASLGRAGDFDVFVIGDMIANNTDIEGRVAIGGNAQFSNIGIGTRLDETQSAARATMVVAGDLSFMNGSVTGDAMVGGTLGATEQTYRQGTFGLTASPINFEMAYKHLADVSSTLANQPASLNASIAPWGAIEMDAVGRTGITYFDITHSDLENATSWDIAADDGATVIINVSGSDVSASNFQMTLNGQPLQSGSVAPFHVLINFSEATSLSSTAFSWQGSILAPHAAFDFNNGHVNGQVYVHSITGGGEYHFVPMQPELPTIEASTQSVFAVVDTTHEIVEEEVATDTPHGLLKATHGFDVFVINDFHADFSSADGSVAVGGNADFFHVGIGTGTDDWINEDALVVSGDLSFQDGQGSSHGPIAVGGSASGVADADVRTAQPVDFQATTIELIELSNEFALLPPTGVVETTPWNAITLDATGTPGETSVFNVDGAALEQASSLNINGDAGSTVIVNVSGQHLSIGNFGIFLNGEALVDGDVSPFELLFNFHDAESVQSSYFAWQGGVLAPHAHWQLDNASVLGELAVANLTSTSVGFYADVVGGVVTDENSNGGTSTGGNTGGGPSNSTPAAADSQHQTCEFEVVTGELGSLVQDRDGDTLTYSLQQQPQNGTIRIDLDGNFVYEANLHFVGNDAFTYMVDDGNGGTATGIVSIDVVDCTPPEVDLSLTKSTTNVTAGVRWSRHGNSDQIAYPYDVFEYSVTVTNNSDYKASGIVIRDVTPENVDIWKTGDSLRRSETGKKWNNNYWVGQVHTLNGFNGSPEFVDPTNGTVTVVEAGTASSGQTISPGANYGLANGSVTWELGIPLEAGESVTLKYYGMREVYTAYNWSFGTQFVTEATIIAIDQVDSNLGNNQAGARSWWVSPVAFDLTNDGSIGTTGISTVKGHEYAGGRLVDFDIDADGSLDRIEWFSGDGDGILVDVSKIGPNRQIDGAALFGDQGGRYANGFEKLALRDIDADGWLTDDELLGLALWLDDGDAKLESGELQALAAHDIATLKVTMELDDAGRMLSSATRTDGGSVLVEDVWFARS